MRLLKERAKLVDADFHLLALAFNRTRLMHPFDLSLSSRSLACPLRACVSAHDLAGDEIHQDQLNDLDEPAPRRIGREGQAADPAERGPRLL